MNEPPPPPKSLSRVKHIALILSGKGGVGKSSVTLQTALTLVSKGFKVGVLDIDLTGPSIPRMFGLENQQIIQTSEGWQPVKKSENLSVISIGFLISNKNSSVVWKGPKKSAMIKQFITDVNWGELDYLLIDTPPGTSDEHISIAENLRNIQVDGCFIVTTPQLISISDVLKEIDFCNKIGFKIIGIIENMSGFICPYCDECSDIFSRDGGLKLAEKLHLTFLGSLPIDPKFVELVESQHDNLVELYAKSDFIKKFEVIVDKYLAMGFPSRVDSNITAP